MGQAKQRGDFEQRKAEAIRLEAERLERQKVELAVRREAERRANSLLPASAKTERPRQRHSAFGRMSLAAATVMALSMGAVKVEK